MPLPFPMFVKPANLGSSVGISKGAQLRGAEGGAGTGRPVRPQDHRRAGHRGARVRMLGAGKRPARGRRSLRDPAFARILRLRRQVPAQPGPRGAARRSDGGADGRDPEARGGGLSGGRLRGDGAGGLPDGNQNRGNLRQRDQYSARIHLHQHVPEDVGEERNGLSPTDRPPDRAGAGAPRERQATRFSR